jgi:hypothetical protein
MVKLLLKGEINAADYNPQQGFDGSPITWDLTIDAVEEDVKVALEMFAKGGIEYGPRDGSDYVYFWYKDLPTLTFGPGDSVEVHSDGTVRLFRKPEQVNKSKRSKFATWE